MNELLKVITLVNQLVGLLTKFGVTFQQVVELQQRAAAEGRELNVNDLDILLARVEESRNRLKAAIEAAKAANA